jgi:hypothetical protein
MLNMLLFSTLMLSASKQTDSISIQATVSRKSEERFKYELVLKNATNWPLGMMSLTPLNPGPLGYITTPEMPDSVWNAGVEYEQDGESVNLVWMPKVHPFDTYPIKPWDGVFRAVFYSTSVDTVPMKFKYSITGPKAFSHSGFFRTYPPKK